MAISVGEALERARQILNRNPKATYSQHGRTCSLTALTYDCSSFIGSVWNVAQVPATQGMVNLYCNSYNFQYKHFSELQGTNKFKKGDILVYNNGSNPDDGHTAMIWEVSRGVPQTIIQAGGPAGYPQPNVLPFSDIPYGHSGYWQDILRSDNTSGAGGIRLVKWQEGIIKENL